METFNIILQENFRWRETLESSSLPRGLNLLDNISRINITTDAIESIPPLLKNFEIDNLSWIAFIPQVNKDNYVYYYSGKLFDVATCGCNDELWKYGSYIILPSNSLDDDMIKLALDMQMKLGDSIVEGVLTHFKCIIISGNDGRTFDIVWRKDWSYAEKLIEKYNAL